MMLYPSGDAFLTCIQEGRSATATVTASDDLCIVVDSIRAKLDPLGIKPRIIVRSTGTLVIRARLEPTCQIPGCGCTGEAHP